MYQKEYWERKELKKRRSPTHPVIVEYVVSKIDKIRERVPITKDTTLLEIGCGNGFFTYHWNRICSVTGVDYSRQMLEMNPVDNVLQMDVNDLSFKENSFDIVFCHAVLHHVDDIGRAIREMARVSKKYVVILEPNRTNPLMYLFSALVKEERKALKFSRKYLEKVTKEDGLAVTDAFSMGLMVPNMTPGFLLPVVKHLHFKQPLGMTNVIIAEKPSGNQ